jgi:hypothetical protein
MINRIYVPNLIPDWSYDDDCSDVIEKFLLKFISDLNNNHIAYSVDLEDVNYVRDCAQSSLCPIYVKLDPEWKNHFGDYILKFTVYKEFTPHKECNTEVYYLPLIESELSDIIQRFLDRGCSQVKREVSITKELLVDRKESDASNKKDFLNLKW